MTYIKLPKDKDIYPRSSFLGFDHMFDQINKVQSTATDTYPPHNVVQFDKFKYLIEVAVAGFKEEQIDIELKDHVLKISGDRPQRRDQNLYVHKGISARKFSKSFRLSEYAEVKGANLQDGILTVSIEVVLPEEKQPRKISISTNSIEEFEEDANLIGNTETASNTTNVVV